ncbi:hypothetical protein OAG92_00465 [Akkermansiaceae bacterium]|nr:hypothetical protein [bacterium]MDB4800693.1 hypothetical protein [Akkermansiaceae bacterium]
MIFASIERFLAITMFLRQGAHVCLTKARHNFIRHHHVSVS